jgi:hypothetical protein
MSSRDSVVAALCGLGAPELCVAWVVRRPLDDSLTGESRHWRVRSLRSWPAGQESMNEDSPLRTLLTQSRQTLRSEAAIQSGGSGQSLEPAYGAGPLPKASFARRITPHSVKMADEVIGPLLENDIGRLSVRDRIGLLRKGLLIRLRIHHSRKNSIRG